MYQYQYPYGNNYMNIGQQTMQQQTIPQQTMPQQIIKVNGENGARAYQMMPNSSVLLLDENNPIVWLAQTDGAGYKTVTPYNITPYAPPEAPDFNSLSDRLKRLEDVIYGKSDFTSNDGTKSAVAADESDKSAKVSK